MIRNSGILSDSHRTCQQGDGTYRYPKTLSIERRRILICSYAAICFDCKDTDSNRRALKIACKRLNFNHFKERLVHFNGTVVI
jgi:hypothetical protein